MKELLDKTIHNITTIWLPKVKKVLTGCVEKMPPKAQETLRSFCGKATPILRQAKEKLSALWKMAADKIPAKDRKKLLVLSLCAVVLLGAAHSVWSGFVVREYARDAVFELHNLPKRSIRKSGKFSYVVSEDRRFAVVVGCRANKRTVRIPKKLGGKPVIGIAPRTGGDITGEDGFSIYTGELFGNKTKVRKVVLPEGLIFIGDEAFSWCETIEEVKLPDSLLRIGERAFDSCSALKSVDLPEGLEYIGVNAFSECDALTELVLPSTLKEVGYGAFMWCENIASLVLRAKDAKFDKSVFIDCVALKTADLSDANVLGAEMFMRCDALEELILSQELQEIPESAFRECTALKTLELPDGLHTIGDCAFSGCTGLEIVSFPEGFENIGKVGFEGCTALKEVIFPDTMKQIGFRAFYGCSALETVHLPAPKAKIDDEAFYECGALKSVNLPAEDYYTAEILGGNAYTLYTNWIAEKTAAEEKADPMFALYKKTREAGFFDYTPVTSGDYVYLPSKDGQYAALLQYTGYEEVETLIIPEKLDGHTVVSIEPYEQYDRPIRIKAKEIIIPETVVYIGEGAFYGCGITSIDLPASLVRIGKSAFGNCKDLASITGGEELRHIGGGAFFDCAIKEWTLPEKVESTGDAVFMCCETLEKCDLSHTKLTVLSQSMFRDCKSLAEVVLPDTVVKIEKKTFEACETLSTLELPEDVQGIGDAAFEGCEALPDAIMDMVQQFE